METPAIHPPLSIIHQDADLVAINKPTGLLVHRSPIDKRETRFAVQELRNQLGQHVYPLHRLDKPTSGVLVFALSSEAASFYGQQFQQHRIQKTYLALVRGYGPKQLSIDHALKDEADDYAGIKGDGEAKEALTHVQSIQKFEIPLRVDRYETTRLSLMQCQPVSGRKHQIRRHLKHIGHPIVGDSRHGKGLLNRACEGYFGVGRLWLACTQMTLMREDGSALVIDAPLATDFAGLLGQLGPASYRRTPPTSYRRRPVSG
ncbi:MAG TPA: pseudouridylate synthase [Oceanospirillaceae bacterium]|nr:pseudouridylate synthase [Oceanospirillaceae bacterium]